MTLGAILQPRSAEARVIIAVGGYDTISTPTAPRCNGMAEIGSFLSDRLRAPWYAHSLPGGFPEFSGNTAHYREVERLVELQVRMALSRAEVVTVLGYSFGATLVLRVVDKISKDITISKSDINLIEVITIDRIAISYPLRPHIASVPSDIRRALNVLQSSFGRPFELQGGSIDGAANANVREVVEEERSRWMELDPDARPCGGLSLEHWAHNLHGFMQVSTVVRRCIYDWLEERQPEKTIFYTEGLWKFEFSGVVRNGVYGYGSFEPETYRRPFDGGNAWFMVYQLTPYLLRALSRRSGEAINSMYIARYDDNKIASGVMVYAILGDVLFFPGACVTDIGPGVISSTSDAINGKAQGREVFGCMPGWPRSIFDGDLTGRVLKYEGPLSVRKARIR